MSINDLVEKYGVRENVARAFASCGLSGHLDEFIIFKDLPDLFDRSSFASGFIMLKRHKNYKFSILASQVEKHGHKIKKKFERYKCRDAVTKIYNIGLDKADKISWEPKDLV